MLDHGIHVFGRIRVLLMFAAVLGMPLAVAAASGEGDPREQQNRPTVLLLNSYGPDSPHEQRQQAAMVRTIRETFGAEWTLTTDSVSANLPDRAVQSQRALKRFRERYNRSAPDLLILNNTPALEFWLSHRSEVAPGVPAVFCGSYEWFDEFDDPSRDFTGVVEQTDAAGTVELMRVLRPDLKRVLLVVSDQPIARSARRAAEGTFAPMVGGVRHDWVEAHTIEDVSRAVSGGQSPTGVVLLCGTLTDRRGVSVSATHWLASHHFPPVPVGVLYETAMDGPALCGMMTRPESSGNAAGKLAARVLTGERAGSIPIEPAPVFPGVNWRELQRQMIPISRVPASAELLNVPSSWFQRHRTAIIATTLVTCVIVLGIQSAAIALLVASRRRRRAAEATLRDTASRLQLALDAAGMGTWDANLGEDNVSYSAEAAAICGLGDKALRFSSSERLLAVHPDDRGTISRDIRNADSKTRSHSVEYRVLRPEGGVQWLCSHFVRLEDPGTPGRLIGLVQDITRRKQIEEQLRENEERYRLAALSITDTVYDWDIVAGMVLTSGSGAPGEGEPLQRPHDLDRFSDAVHPEDRVRVRSHLVSALESGAPRWHCEYRYRAGDGGYGVFVDRATIVRDGSGRAVRMVGAMTDVTRRREDEQKLRESNARLRAILESEPECVKILDRDGRVLELNPAGLAMVEADTLEQVAGASAYKLIRPEHHARYRDALARCLAGEQTALVFEIQGLRGTRRWMEQHAVGLRDASGEITQVLCVTRDITPRLESERRIRESEQRFRQFAEAVDASFWIRSVPEGEYLFLSAATAKLYGVEPGRLPRTVHEYRRMIHPDDLEAVVSKFERWIAGGAKEPLEVTNRVILADGIERWWRNRVFSLPEPDGTVKRIAGITEDVTARQEESEALVESERRFRHLAQAVDHVFWIVAPEPVRVLYVSPAVESVLGIRSEDLYMDPDLWLKAIHPEDQPRIRENLRRWASRGSMGTFEHKYRVLLPDGGMKWILDRGHAVRDDRGRLLYYAGIADDITHRELDEQTIRRNLMTQRLLLQELDHRVKNTLAGLIGMVGLCEQRERSVSGFADAVRRRVNAMAEVHAMLSARRWAPMKLADVVEGVRPAELPGMFTCGGPETEIAPRQAGPLGMILQELFSNSLKYGALSVPNGQASLTWDVRTEEDGRRLMLEWVETGGPEIGGAPTPGLGTTLIEGFARFELRGEVSSSYPRAGAHHRFTLSLGAAVPDGTIQDDGLVTEREATPAQLAGTAVC